MKTKVKHIKNNWEGYRESVLDDDFRYLSGSVDDMTYEDMINSGIIEPQFGTVIFIQ